MAMVVESVSAEESGSSTDTIVIDAPTGVEVGDLLIAVLSAYSVDGSGAGSVDLKSGWTDAVTDELGNDIGQSIQYKVADSSDALAASFSFSKSTSTDLFVGYIIRASGQNTLTPLGTSDWYEEENVNSTAYDATVDAYTPGVDGALVVLNLGGMSTTGAGATRTFSAFGGVTNVSFSSAGYNGGGTDGSGGVTVASVYGVQSTSAEIDGFTATSSQGYQDYCGQIAIFLPPKDATGTNTLVTTDTEIFTHSGTCDGVTGNTLAEATGEAVEQTGRGEAPQQWTEPTKSTDNWTNKNI